MNNQKKNSPLRAFLAPVASLFIICTVSTALLAAAHTVTMEPIEQARESALSESMMSVVPRETESFEEIALDGGSERCFRALDGSGETVAYAVSTSAAGYGGTIAVMTGIGADGDIIAVNVYDNSDETPGLGAKTSLPDFTRQFGGLSADRGVAVSKDIGKFPDYSEIDAVTGATISSRGAAAAVSRAIEIYNEVKE